MAEANARQLEPHCCEEKGFFWDEALLYAPHTKWKDTPSPAFWDGPVWKIIPGLESTPNIQRP